MIAKATVYLNEDRTKAVPSGDKSAKFLLVREGTEIADKELEKYEGATALAGSEKTTKKAPVTKKAPAESENPPPFVQHREVKTRKR